MASGAGAGVATAAAAYGLVGALGAASTGTAISTLGGAAATNATLAWLGGGALVAGGGGMALGAMVLNFVVAGPALLVAGLFASGKAEEVETEVAKAVAGMDVAEAKMAGQRAVLSVIVRRVDELHHATEEVERALADRLTTASPERIEDAYDVARIAKALGDLLDVAILDRNGNLAT